MEICTIIAESNGFKVNAIPVNTPLTVDATLLKKYLHPDFFTLQTVHEKSTSTPENLSITDRLKNLRKKILGW